MVSWSLSLSSKLIPCHLLQYLFIPFYPRINFWSIGIKSWNILCIYIPSCVLWCLYVYCCTVCAASAYKTHPHAHILRRLCFTASSVQRRSTKLAWPTMAWCSCVVSRKLALPLTRNLAGLGEKVVFFLYYASVKPKNDWYGTDRIMRFHVSLKLFQANVG